MKSIQFLYIAFLLLLTSCGEDTSVNPNLIGTWKTPGATYTFFENENYAIEYINEGNVNAPQADSIFGTYINDNKRNIITFNQKGHRIHSTQEIIHQELNGSIWSYEIKGDELHYESKTQIGVLKRNNTKL